MRMPRRAGDAARTMRRAPNRRLRTTGSSTRSSARCCSQSSQRQLKAVQTRYQLAAAQREAEIHRLRHVELADANAELEQLNDSLRASDEQKIEAAGAAGAADLRGQPDGPRQPAAAGQAARRRVRPGLRHARPLAVALIDVDHFKRVNDRYSHAVGDAALRETRAAAARRSVRHTDLVARLGGEEFVMVLVETDAEPRGSPAKSCASPSRRTTGSGVHPALAMTVSIGVLRRHHGAGAERMLAAADRNLYVGQSEGTELRRRRGRRRPGCRCRGLELAHQPDHHAEDLQRAFGADHRIGLVLRAAARNGRARGRAASA